MLPTLYRSLTAAAAPLVLAYLKSRCRQGKEDPLRFDERRGISGDQRPQKPLVWVHAASVGEAMSVLALIGMEEVLEATARGRSIYND